MLTFQPDTREARQSDASVMSTMELHGRPWVTDWKVGVRPVFRTVMECEAAREARASPRRSRSSQPRS